jgi:AcrR family transcriptional regulator
MSTRFRPLADVHGDATRRLILDAALASLEAGGEITARGAALHSGISERTVFRHFPSREQLLAACAAHFAQRIQAPAVPTSVQELLAFPRGLFNAFEAHRELVRASWHSELRSYMIAAVARERWVAISRLIDSIAPHAPAQQRRLVAASVRYHLTASTWHYYRFVMGLTLQDTIAGVEQLIAMQLAALERPAGRPRRPPTPRVAKP